LIIGARFDYSTRYGAVFNPRMGFIVKPFKNTLIKAIYGKAFQSPSLFFQYEQWGAPSISLSFNYRSSK
jgi:outer membrane receptor for ferrienterochelin and colicin